ncbi:hypothetical protein F2Q70_00002036 [Brassica cretica]|uniref:Uncharacterized protein n=1 Tax=Brassica cretica TaxID=69181 RepID=A0A8S9INX0_BRACR|nr:hypothetical protein F2Q70_00002036 [Brassica cretica]
MDAFRTADSILHLIDSVIRKRIASYRLENPALSSSLMQRWLATPATPGV